MSGVRILSEFVVRCLSVRILSVAILSGIRILSRFSEKVCGGVRIFTVAVHLTLVVTLILTHMTLTLRASILKADIHVNVRLDTLMMALNALIPTNVAIPKMYQLAPLVQILMLALLSLAILVSK